MALNLKNTKISTLMPLLVCSRTFCVGQPCNKIGSSKDWFQRHSKDKFVKQAQKDQYRARSAYKLLEIQKDHKIVKPGDKVVECGGAPGAWTQVISKQIGDTGKLVSCDLLNFEPVDNAVILPNTDFTTPQNQAKIISLFEGSKIDVVVSDMSPNFSGSKGLDQDASLNLVLEVVKFSLLHLAQDGKLLTKIFQSKQTDRLITSLQKFYRCVERVKPAASRKESSEMYVLATGFHKPNL